MANRRSGIVRLLVVLGLLLAASSACKKKIDMDKVKAKISEWLGEEGLAGGETIVCPSEERPLKQGDTFECVVTLAGGGELTVKVTQEDDEGTGRFTLLRTTVLQTRLVVESITKRIKEKSGEDYTVDCGAAPTLGSGVGTIFECTATSPAGEVLPIEGRQIDTGGQFSWKLKGEDGEAPVTEGAEPAEATE